MQNFNFGFQSKGFNETTTIDKSICSDTCVRKIFSGRRMLLSSVMLCSAETCFEKCLLYIWAQAGKWMAMAFLKSRRQQKAPPILLFLSFVLKKKCWGLQPLLQATLKKNIIDTFSRGSFLLMGGDFFRQKGDIFATKASHLLFQADQGWLLIDFYRTMSSFTT